MRALIGGFVAAIGLCATPCWAQAPEFCVTCTAPDASYRCQVEGESAAAHSSRGQLLCITELAKSGGHSSCSAGRSPTTSCPGALRTVMFPPGADLSPLPAADAPLMTPAPSSAYAPPPVAAPNGPQQPPPPSPTQAQPNTVEQLAKKTVETTGNGLEKAGKAVTDTGNAIGNAAKKTWTCIATLFGDC